jgi:hypothetical protein
MNRKTVIVKQPGRTVVGGSWGGPVLLVVVGLMLLCFVTAADAQAYRCETKTGVVYQQAPCPGGREIARPAPVTVADANRARLELLVMQNKVAIGMTARDVERAWGPPHKINRSIHEHATIEQWVYRYAGRQFVYLENGIVRSIQD